MGFLIVLALLLLLYETDVISRIFVNAICLFTIVICLSLSKLWFCDVFCRFHLVLVFFDQNVLDQR